MKKREEKIRNNKGKRKKKRERERKKNSGLTRYPESRPPASLPDPTAA